MTSRIKRALAATAFTMMAPAAFAQTAPAPAPAGGTAAPAAGAQATANVTTGATIYDTAGGVVGTVESVANGSAIVSTGTTKVNLPLTSFGAGDRGPVLALTRAQLEAEASQAAAASTQALDTLLTTGSPVYGRGGTTQLGTVKATDANLVTVTAISGADVRLPRNGFGVAQNRLIIGMTAAEFQAAVGSATAAAPASGAPAAAGDAAATTDAAAATDAAAPATATSPGTMSPSTTGGNAAGSTTATPGATSPGTTATTPSTTRATPPRN